MPFKCFIHASVIKPLTYCFLAKGTLSAVMGFCRVTVTFGGLLFKAWGLFSLYVCRLDVKAIDYDGSSRFLSLSLSPVPVLRSRRSWHWSAQASISPEISNTRHQVECHHYCLFMLFNTEKLIVLFQIQNLIIIENWKSGERRVKTVFFL